MIRFFSEKPSETTPDTATPAPTSQSEIQRLQEHRAASNAELDRLQHDFDQAEGQRRDLHKQRAAETAGHNSYGGTPTQIFPGTPLGRAITEANQCVLQLRTAVDGKRAEVETLTKQIHAIERQVPGQLRRAAIEAALPLVFELVDALCVAAAHESEYVSLGGNVEHSVPWEFALAGGEGIELETIMSRWLKALKREGFTIPGNISDNSRHLPAPASVHVRVQVDSGLAGHAARCGAAGGFGPGFREGYLTRARNF